MTFSFLAASAGRTTAASLSVGTKGALEKRPKHIAQNIFTRVGCDLMFGFGADILLRAKSACGTTINEAIARDLENQMKRSTIVTGRMRKTRSENG